MRIRRDARSSPSLLHHRSGRASEADAERISRILHDEVGQVVSAAGLKLALLRMDCEKRAPETAERLEAVQQLLETAMAPLRRLISELAAEPLARNGQTRAKQTRQ